MCHWPNSPMVRCLASCAKGQGFKPCHPSKPKKKKESLEQAKFFSPKIVGPPRKNIIHIFCFLAQIQALEEKVTHNFYWRRSKGEFREQTMVNKSQEKKLENMLKL